MAREVRLNLNNQHFKLLLLLTLCFTTALVNGSQGEQDDEITDLPGLNYELNFKHYSGYLQVSSNHFLHYWFVTSQNNAQNDPLVFWFNGGPGCSSMEGIIKELGPYLVQPDGKTLAKNPHAWNKNASLVFMESPAGVGYSYANDGNVSTGDDLTAHENYEAVKQFFDRHPSFRNHDVFITGESYAGIYVPMLTALIVDGQKKFPINLKGMAVGNGYVDAPLDVDTSARFAYGHGLIDERMWRHKIVQQCCGGNIEHCNLATLDGECGQIIEDIFNFLWDGGLNIYDLYRECDNPQESLKKTVMMRGMMPPKMWQRFQQKKEIASKIAVKKQNSHRINMLSVSENLPCMDDSDMEGYMNLPEVRKALHIPESLKHLNWQTCSDTLNYRRKYDNVYGFVKKILRAHVPVLFYYGDTDMACNFLLGQEFSARLGLRLIAEKEQWMFDGQIGGFKTLYSQGFTFLTVRGAGHMVPQWRPAPMEYVFNQFLQNKQI